MATPPGSLSIVPEFPALSDRVTYNVKAYAFCSAMRITFAPEMLALANGVYANAVEVAANAVLAAANAQQAVSAAGVTLWVSGTSYTAGSGVTPPSCVVSPITLRTYRRLVSGAGAIDPSADPANWRLVTFDPQWITKTASYTASAGDSISANTAAGPFTITLPPSPADNDIVRWRDHAGTFGVNKLTFARNGKNIMGYAQDMDVSTQNLNRELTFIAATNDWRF